MNWFIVHSAHILIGMARWIGSRNIFFVSAKHFMVGYIMAR